MGRLNYSDCCVIDLRMPVRGSKHQSRQDAGRRGAKSVTCLKSLLHQAGNEAGQHNHHMFSKPQRKGFDAAGRPIIVGLVGRAFCNLPGIYHQRYCYLEQIVLLTSATVAHDMIPKLVQEYNVIIYR